MSRKEAKFKEYLEGIFRAAVAAADPGRLVGGALRIDREAVTLAGGEGPSSARWEDVSRVYLVGGGKAGRAMGESAVAVLGRRVTAGTIAVPREEGGTSGPVRFVEADHPLPDAGSREAAREMLSLLASAGEDDLVLALLSGGGSSMISAPPEGLSPEDKEAMVRLLLRSGADIAEVNTVRKHLSRVKGGRMARVAFPARVFALLLSDVSGDDPSVIASGPFSPDPTTYRDAQNVLLGRKILSEVPSAAGLHIAAGVAGAIPETPKPGDPVFGRVVCAVVGSNAEALAAASAAAKREEADVRLLPGFLRGEARECARAFVAELRKAGASSAFGRPVVLIAGGETTVTVRGSGRGGRNQEFALSAAIEFEGEAGMAVLAGATDGVDGPTAAAGAVAEGSTCSRARAAGLSPADHLADNDSYSFFRATSGLVVTGPTGTNVADIAIGVVRRASGSPP